MKDFKSALERIGELTKRLSYTEGATWNDTYEQLKDEMGQWAEEIMGKIKAADELAAEVAKLADYWGKTCPAMLALEAYRKAGVDLIPPKRTREVTRYFNIYPYGEASYVLEEDARANAQEDALAVAVPVTFTVEY